MRDLPAHHPHIAPNRPHRKPAPLVDSAPLDSLSWQQKVEFVQGLMLYPALTVMVFIRRKVGFRQLKPTRLIGMAVLLIALGYFAGNGVPQSAPVSPFGMAVPQPQPAGDPLGGKALIGYALAMLAWGLFQRRQRWNDLRGGVRWHTRTVGISYFEFLPLSPYVVYRYVDDPIVCFLIGALVSLVSHPLGLWLMFSGAALAVYEQAVYEKSLDRQLDVLDGLIDSEVQAEVAKHFQGGGSEAQKPLRIEDTAGIPTGLAPDITKQIALRRKRAPLSDGQIDPPGGFGYSPGDTAQAGEVRGPRPGRRRHDRRAGSGPAQACAG